MLDFVLKYAMKLMNLLVLCMNMYCLVLFLKPLVSYSVIRPCNSCTVFHLHSDNTWQLSAGNGERGTENGKMGKVQFSSCPVLICQNLSISSFSFSFSYSYFMLFLLFCCSIPNWVGSETDMEMDMV